MRTGISDFKIIESTLREGEQFVGASFTTQQKLEIAQTLDEFGVEYIELTSPVVSPGSYEDIKAIVALGLRAKILTHIRCDKNDAAKALEIDLDGIDIVIGTSSFLRRFSHGKDIPQIIEAAVEVLSFIKAQRPELEVRFSTEDSFRSSWEDLFMVYKAVDEVGVDRVGVADTVGVATPFEVYNLVSKIKSFVRAEVEFHGHNDSGCAIANSYAALEAGATCIDTSVLGIGERNGITPLGGLIARLYALDPRLVGKYRLEVLRELDQMVARWVGVDIPFNNYITGITAFTHKAGIHAKAILNEPQTYEILNPEAFGLSRYISVAHRLTGWHAIKWRAEQLGLELDERQIKEVTAHLKALADEKPPSLDDVDTLLKRWANGWKKEEKVHAEV
ncbi:MAG: homocitrate synthase [Anaerolineae bacterium]|jgi:homocitrate synthase|nr:homocitrate synthase [Anaerolineae bacterium]MDH7472877.1 homocitrate synthase [Anaerolineae bacterium]